MKFICTKENLMWALTCVNNLASKQTNLPILNNILIRATESKVELIATNLEIATRAILRAKVETEGEFTIPAKTITDFVQLLSNEQITLERKENELLIESGSSKTKIKGADAEDYPVIPEIEEEKSFAVDVEDLQTGLAKSVVAAAKNEIRPELAGVYFGFNTDRYKGLVLAATDSYRLAEARVPLSQGDDEIKCIVPARTVQELARLFGVTRKGTEETKVRIWVSSNQLSARYGEVEFTSRLVEGNYPDYAQIIPSNFKTTVIVPKQELINKIKAASLFSVIGVNAVSLKVEPTSGTLTLASTSTQTGEHSSEIDGDVTGDENDTLLNFRYVLDGLSHMDGDKIALEINSNDTPCSLKVPDNDSYQYIVMPIRQ